MTQWTSSSSYADRVSHLTTTTGALGSAMFLPSLSILDDGVRDGIFGGTSQDFFIISLLDVPYLQSHEQKLVL